MPTPSYYRIEAGLLVRSTIRALLVELKFQQEMDEFIETKAHLDSVFLIRNLSPYGQAYIERILTDHRSRQADLAEKRALEKKQREAFGNSIASFVAAILFLFFALFVAHILLA